MISNEHNWAGNYNYGAARLHKPRSLDELKEIIAHSAKVKALGTRHSFNDIADTSEDLISLQHFNRVIELDRARRTVTMEAGMRYGELGQYLHAEGFALPNLASLPHISVAGACATGTHGSGVGNGSLSTSVSAMELVTADGQVQNFSREQNGEQFPGMVIGLGAFGIITNLTLDIIPTFMLRQNVFENLPLTELESHFDEIMSGAYSVSLFTDWQQESINQVWVKSRIKESASDPSPRTLFGATAATADRHPIGKISSVNCTPQMGVPGPWHERLPHFRLDYTPSSGAELQSEYFVPRRHAVAAIKAITGLSSQISPLLFISEIRTVAADDLWLSPCYQQACVTIHFTWKQDWPAVKNLLPIIEEQLAPFDARPHWGKLFTLTPKRLQSLYPKLADFQQLVQTLDPQGKFRNAFLDRYVFAA